MIDHDPVPHFRDHEAVSSNLATRTMQSVLIGSEYPVMDTLLFYFLKSSYCNLFRGVAECYAFSCFHDNVGLRDLPAIRHIKGTDAVVVDHDTLIGNAVLLFSVVHLNVVDQFCDHALCNGGRIRVPPYRFKKIVNVHALALVLFQLQPQSLDFLCVFALLLFIAFGHFGKPGIVDLAGHIVLIEPFKKHIQLPVTGGQGVQLPLLAERGIFRHLCRASDHGLDNIYNLLGIAEDYILKNIRWRSEIVGTERTETPEIPVAVIREVLANSFAHAVYNGRTNHEICIHPGMITIYSPGEYASNHKPEDYMKGNYESVIRNATIAKILYLNKSIEQFGSGFKRINSLCKDAGIRFSYERDELGFKFILYRPELQSDIPRVTLDVTLNGTEMAVLAFLKQKPDSSRGEIADKISKTVRTVQRALDSLRDKGYIQRVGSKQEPYWEVLK